jgi:uncharacterized OsmC-like protein
VEVNSSPPIVVTHLDGVRFAAEARAHRIIVDQTERAGGKDSGPEPIELLGMALGTCIAFYIQRFCQTRGLSSEGMRVEVRQHHAREPHRVSRFAVRVIPPNDFPEEHVKVLDRVARSCPAHNTLAHGAEVSIEIEAASPATQ